MKNTKIKLSNQKIALDSYGFLSVYDEKHGLIFRGSYQNTKVMHRIHPSNGYTEPWSEIIIRDASNNSRLSYNVALDTLEPKTLWGQVKPDKSDKIGLLSDLIEKVLYEADSRNNTEPFAYKGNLF